MMAVEYPVIIKMRSKQFEELHGCEYGSYEDHIVDEDCPQCDGTGLCPIRKCILCKGSGRITVRNEPYDRGALHIIELLDRAQHKTRLELRSQEEIVEFYCASLSGTFGLYCLGTCLRIYEQLNPLIEDRTMADSIRKGSLGF